jgi:hypothetical protein
LSRGYGAPSKGAHWPTRIATSFTTVTTSMSCDGTSGTGRWTWSTRSALQLRSGLQRAFRRAGAPARRHDVQEGRS